MSKRKDFSPQQLHAIELLSSPSKMTNEQIAKEVGISVTQLWRWRTQNDDFINAVNDVAYLGMRSRLPEVYDSLLDNAIRDGNVKAQELILKFADKFVERTEQKVTGQLEIKVGFEDDEDDE